LPIGRDEHALLVGRSREVLDLDVEIDDVERDPARHGVGRDRTAALVVTVGSFFAVQPLIDAAKKAASSLPF